MKKLNAALAALAVAGTASAQSSLTMFGVVDAAFNDVVNESDVDPVSGGTVKASVRSLRSGGLKASRLGFRGTEDLGGGLSAGFLLESTLGIDTGTVGRGDQYFNRRSTLNLAGGFGELRLGREYAPTYVNDFTFDPFGIVGVGRNPNIVEGGGTMLGRALGLGENQNYDRADNSISYFLPAKLGGFNGQLTYALPERTEYAPAAATPPHDAKNPLVFDGRYVGGRLGYRGGPLEIAAAYGENVNRRNFQAGGRAEIRIGNIGAAWDFGVLKLMGEYNRTELRSNVVTPTAIRRPSGSARPQWVVRAGAPADVAASSRSHLIGAQVPVGPGQVRVSYSYTRFDLGDVAPERPSSRKFALGYVHNLSKRTALYATGGYVKNKNSASGVASALGMTVGGSTTGLASVRTSAGYELGLSHAF